MDIVSETGKVDFASIMSLLRAEWPKEWGEISDGKMIEEFEKSCDYRYDVNKYLRDDGNIIGWYRYSTWPREESNKENAHTLDIVIDEKYQGQGLGRKLMEDLLDDCRKRGFRKIMSRTIEGNASSFILHEKTGFEIAFKKGTDIVWEKKFD